MYHHLWGISICVLRECQAENRQTGGHLIYTMRAAVSVIFNLCNTRHTTTSTPPTKSECLTRSISYTRLVMHGNLSFLRVRFCPHGEEPTQRSTLSRKNEKRKRKSHPLTPISLFSTPQTKKMVVKTELCAFSEYRIYPGHGQKYVRRDGQLVTVSTSKVRFCCRSFSFIFSSFFSVLDVNRVVLVYLHISPSSLPCTNSRCNHSACRWCCSKRSRGSSCGRRPGDA